MQAPRQSCLSQLFMLVVLLIGMLSIPVSVALAQGTISTVVPSPDLPGVPGDIPIDGFATINLEGGSYQWQTTNRTTLTRDDQPITVHTGFLLSIDQALVVLKAGAPSRPVPAGKSLPLKEGESILPVTSGDQPGRIVIVEFANVRDLAGTETPDQVVPVTLDPGAYTIALLDITNLDPNGPTPGQVIAQAAGPALLITSRDESTDTGEDLSTVPLVVWLASIFRTGDAPSTSPGASGSVPTATTAPPVQGSAEDEASPGSGATDAQSTPTTQPVQGSAEEDASSEGDGSGNGQGNGSGSGAGNGSGNGQGNGSGSGAGNGSGNGQGNGSGSGAGNGTGDQDDATSVSPVLPEVPADIPVSGFIVLDLPAGDYQWQTTSSLTLQRTDTPINVHNGFIIAVDAPVILLKAGAPSVPIQAGENAVLHEGERILPTAAGDTPSHFVIVELAPVNAVDPSESPDQVLPLTLTAGVYTLALLDVSGMTGGSPTPSEIIAGAAGPGFGISKNEELGVDTSDTPPLTWLVSIFPATESDLALGESGKAPATTTSQPEASPTATTAPENSGGADDDTPTNGGESNQPGAGGRDIPPPAPTPTPATPVQGGA